MKRILIFFTVATVCFFNSCNSTPNISTVNTPAESHSAPGWNTSYNANFSINQWDLNHISYNNNWDKKATENGRYTLGIIDIDSVVSSDDKTISIPHNDLIETIVLRLTQNCEIKSIVLQNEPSNAELILAIEKLINQGCKVINISLGTVEPIILSDFINDKIEHEGVIIVCASGNLSKELTYPALCNKTISVLACDYYGNVDKNFENIDKISYTAPGLHINVRSGYFSGSSIAAVYVSVACAAYKSVYPNASYEQICSVLQKSSISPTNFSYGIIQYNNLLRIKPV